MARIGIAAAALVLASLATAGGSAARHVPKCVSSRHAVAGVRSSHVLTTSGAVIVYRVRRRDFDSIYACRRGSSRTVHLGDDDAYATPDSEYGPSETVGAIRIAGPWVSATLETGLDNAVACSKYTQDPTCQPRVSIVVADTASARLAVLNDVGLASHKDSAGNTVVSSLELTLLSGAGAVVWLESARRYKGLTATAEPSSLYGCKAQPAARGSLSCAPRLLASGVIPPAGVRLQGTVASFTLDGRPATAPV